MINKKKNRHKNEISEPYFPPDGHTHHPRPPISPKNNLIKSQHLI